MIPIFNNLHGFFNHIEFCPLCGKRTVPNAILTKKNINTTSETNNNHIIIFDDNSKLLSINLFDNIVNTDTLDYFRDMTESDGYGLMLIVSKECKKYHFYYSAFVIINFDTLMAEEIIMDRYHFVRRLKGSHFVVNANYLDNITTIRMTNNYKTKEIKLPFIDFDLNNKRKINNKLRNIELLG
jgi:hypothetical protein